MEYSPPPLFKQGASARAKVVVFSLIAIALLVIDARMRTLGAIRQAVGTASRKRWIGAGLLALLAVLVLGGGMVAAGELSLLDEARSVKAQLQAIAARVSSAGLDLDRPTLNALQADLTAATANLKQLEARVDGDLVIAVLGRIEPTATTRFSTVPGRCGRELSSQPAVMRSS